MKPSTQYYAYVYTALIKHDVIYLCMRLYTYTYICMHICVYVCMYTCTFMHVHARSHTRTHLNLLGVVVRAFSHREADPSE